MTKTRHELLDKFAEEIQCGELSLEMLIDAHRRTRIMMQDYSRDMKAIQDEERVRAFEYAKEYALAKEWISVEKLRKMTIGELVEYMGGE